MPYKPEGNPQTAKYIVVAEAPAKIEIVRGRPLQGPSGMLFDSCLNMAGIARSQCYITNVFDEEVKKKKDSDFIYNMGGDILWTKSGGFGVNYGTPHVERLVDEIASCKNAPAILTLGGVATDALTGINEVMKYRGSVLQCNRQSIADKKVIPTPHPAASLRGNYLWRYLITYDMDRMKKEAQFWGIKRPDYRMILRPSYEETIKLLHNINDNVKIVAVDIEVSGVQTSAISFAWSSEDVMSIVFDDYSEQEEVEIWVAIAEVMGNDKIEKIFHTNLFDVWFLLTQNGIVTKGKVHDIAILQHIMYPEFLRNLAFQASIYTDQPYWKNMVKHGSISKSDG